MKGANKCAICAKNHATEEFPSISGLKSVLEGENYEPEPLHAMGARRNWAQVSVGMAPKPHFYGYNAPPYSYYNNNNHSQHW